MRNAKHGYVDVTTGGQEFESIPMSGNLLHGYVMADGAYAAHAIYGESPEFITYENAILDCANECGTGCEINGCKFDMAFRLVDGEIDAGFLRCK